MKKGWEEKKLGEVCDVIAGQSPEGKYYNKVGDGLPFYQGKKEFNDKFIGEPTTWTTKVTKEAQQGDVLISVRAPVGPVNFSMGKICIGRGLAAIRASEIIDREYLYNFLLKHEKDIIGNTGAVFNSINKTQIEDILIPLPLLPEQQRIVAIVEETFDAIARAKENTEKNLQNAREIFKSYLHSIFSNPGNEWPEKTLGGVAIIQSGGTPLRSSKEFWDDGAIPWYSSGELNYLYTGVSERCITEIGLNNSNAKLFPKGSLLVGMYDTAALKMSIIDRDAAFNQAIAGIKPNNELDLIFILHAINAIKPEILNQRRGVRQKNLSLQKIKNISLCIPPLSEQKSVVAKLDALSTETKKLEAIYNQKLTNLEELKKSILQKAFNGEL